MGVRTRQGALAGTGGASASLLINGSQHGLRPDVVDDQRADQAATQRSAHGGGPARSVRDADDIRPPSEHVEVDAQDAITVLSSALPPIPIEESATDLTDYAT